MIASIENIYNRLKTKIIYPKTKYQAVFDDNGNRLDTDIAEIKDNLITVEKFTTDNVTINANLGERFTKGVSKTGYIPLGIIEFTTNGSGRSSASLYQCNIENGIANFYVSNKGSTAITINIGFTVIYEKAF